MPDERNRPPRRPPDEEQDIKPDIERTGERRLSPEEALRRDRETYGDDSTFPNREDTEDEHHGSA
ncbi:MAG TPA: hypothetical protein VNG31_08140 [Candidatus Baltobacteraceae bacterium]|nr:hypothetical protein [Candidatus Baltobacteraceae bacterium]